MRRSDSYRLIESDECIISSPSVLLGRRGRMARRRRVRNKSSAHLLDPEVASVPPKRAALAAIRQHGRVWS